MKKILIISLSLLLSACWVPFQFSFDVPVENKTNVADIRCNTWYKVGESTVKSTCHVDNLDGAEQRALAIRAYDAQGFIIGSAMVGKATIGEKVRINKAMLMSRLEEPASITLEVAESL